MKLSSKFFLIFAAITLAFSILAAGAVQFGLTAVKNADRQAISLIIALVREKYPDVDDRDIADVLNAAESDGSAETFLRKYGIAESDVIVLQDRRNFAGVVSLAVSVCVGMGCVSMICFGIYVTIRRNQDRKLTKYLSRINSGNYHLRFDDLSEDQTSVLSSEIYKTTIMLREQSERSGTEKEKLKDSISDISHQLKTPLTSIMIMLDSILEGEMPEELKREFLGDIKNSVNHLTFLTQSMLTLSKLDANTITFHNEKVKLKDIINVSISNTSAIAQDKCIDVKGDCPDITIDCDMRWVCEAVTNIVKNCIEHTKKGGSVTLSAEENPLLIKLSIKDTGCGISKKDLPHIFERFYKGSHSGDTSVGIGLALSKSIIEKCGGYISVQSEEGKGSEFIIKFFKTI
ncbi:MAG: HAMP domain-containing histidine kinase [Clostridia bacterium]|nr:HAMP domain-containing histidine kinase [Clostridia bacterium]